MGDLAAVPISKEVAFELSDCLVVKSIEKAGIVMSQ
jgi:hypothetical protein